MRDACSHKCFIVRRHRCFLECYRGAASNAGSAWSIYEATNLNRNYIDMKDFDYITLKLSALFILELLYYLIIDHRSGYV